MEFAIGSDADSISSAPIVALVNRIGLEHVIFEVKQDPHLAWVFRNFGPEANVGPNLSHAQVLWIEPMRRGLGGPVRYAAFDKWTEPNDDPNARRKRKTDT